MSRRSETKADVPKSKPHVTRSAKNPAPLYRRKPPSHLPSPIVDSPAAPDLPHAKPLAPSHFTLREDGTIAPIPSPGTRHPSPEQPSSTLNPQSSTAPQLIFSSDSPFVRLYHGNSLELLDAIHARYGDAGRFDCISEPTHK